MKRPFGLILLSCCVFGACTFTQKIKSGDDAFGVKQYAVAAQLYQDEYASTEKREDRARKAFLIGQCYEYMREPSLAAPWYRKAYDQGFGDPALEHYADMLRQTEHYQEAIDAYKELMASGTDVQRYRGMITVCTQAMQWKEDQKSSPYEIEPMSFNSSGADYAPYILGPDLLVFTSDREQSTGNSAYAWTGRKHSDLYTVNLNTGVVQPFDHLLNTQDNEGTVAFTRDRSEMFFTRCYQDTEYDSYCKIMVCHAHGGSWSDPEPLSFQQDGINYGHPALTSNDSVLIFSANNPNGTGGYDLYYSQRGLTGWSEPILLSNRVNTQGNERFPTVYNDTLYFSSDYLPGLGGYDIFMTYPDADGQWSPPLNMKAPINSGWDDFDFVVDTFVHPGDQIAEQGYFSSSRNPQNGDDIFLFKKRIVTPVETVAKNDETPLSRDYHIYLAVKTYEPVFEVPGDPNSGRVGKKPLGETILHISEGMAMRREKTDQTGLLVLELDWNKSYTIHALKKGFLNQDRAVNTLNIKKDPTNPVTTLNMDITLEPIFEGKEIVLQNIYYDYDKWFIRDDAKPTLDTLAKMLHDNPEIRIQLSSHTDCRGETEYNQELSQKRAEAAVDYLVSKGISADRLVAVGYGESRLAVDCVCEQCTEAQHQQNRRTTFTILKDQ